MINWIVAERTVWSMYAVVIMGLVAIGMLEYIIRRTVRKEYVQTVTWLRTIQSGLVISISTMSVFVVLMSWFIMRNFEFGVHNGLVTMLQGICIFAGWMTFMSLGVFAVCFNGWLRQHNMHDRLLAHASLRFGLAGMVIFSSSLVAYICL